MSKSEDSQRTNSNWSLNTRSSDSSCGTCSAPSLIKTSPSSPFLLLLPPLSLPLPSPRLIVLEWSAFIPPPPTPTPDPPHTALLTLWELSLSPAVTWYWVNWVMLIAFEGPKISQLAASPSGEEKKSGLVRARHAQDSSLTQ